MTSTLAPVQLTLWSRSVRAIGTTATVLVQEAEGADVAQGLLADELAAIDLACSRFRPDSELEMVHGQAGRVVRVSPLLFEALEVARDVAERTRGAVDPTVGNAIVALGYDRDLDQVLERPAPPGPLGTVVGYMHLQLSRRSRTVRIPRGVRLDLGSTAKAWAADRAASRIADAVGSGVLVSIGGDIATAGSPPPGGWAVGIAMESAASDDEVEQVVAIGPGGLASSSTSVRTWVRGTRTVNHIIDPRTGDCVDPYWRLVSATGASCVDANAVTTAAMVWGADALDRLSRFPQAARLVRHDGETVYVNGWPEDGAA